MKRIAFDCSGTLLGGDSNVVLLFKWFQSKGCEVVIWSNCYDYTLKAKERHGLDAECMMKQCKWDYDNDESQYFDMCVDDEPSQVEYLAAKQVIAVHKIPYEVEEFEEAFGHLLKD
jgi:hypothetical protein